MKQPVPAVTTTKGQLQDLPSGPVSLTSRPAGSPLHPGLCLPLVTHACTGMDYQVSSMALCGGSKLGLEWGAAGGDVCTEEGERGQV